MTPERPGRPAARPPVGRVGVTHGLLGLDARLVEQTELELQRQDPPHRLVDPVLEICPDWTAWRSAALPLSGPDHCMPMSTPAFTALAIAPGVVRDT